MKRVLLMLGIMQFLEEKPQEQLVDRELAKLTKRPPRTEAEKEFHKWLQGCKKRDL